MGSESKHGAVLLNDEARVLAESNEPIQLDPRWRARVITIAGVEIVVWTDTHELSRANVSSIRPPWIPPEPVESRREYAEPISVRERFSTLADARREYGLATLAGDVGLQWGTSEWIASGAGYKRLYTVCADSIINEILGWFLDHGDVDPADYNRVWERIHDAEIPISHLRYALAQLQSLANQLHKPKSFKLSLRQLRTVVRELKPRQLGYDGRQVLWTVQSRKSGVYVKPSNLEPYIKDISRCPHCGKDVIERNGELHCLDAACNWTTEPALCGGQLPDPNYDVVWGRHDCGGTIIKNGDGIRCLECGWQNPLPKPKRPQPRKCEFGCKSGAACVDRYRVMLIPKLEGIGSKAGVAKNQERIRAALESACAQRKLEHDFWQTRLYCDPDAPSRGYESVDGVADPRLHCPHCGGGIFVEGKRLLCKECKKEPFPSYKLKPGKLVRVIEAKRNQVKRRLNPIQFIAGLQIQWHGFEKMMKKLRRPLENPQSPGKFPHPCGTLAGSGCATDSLWWERKN